MAELREARELEALLVERNRELLLAQSLKVDRTHVLEMVVRNEPLHAVMAALFQLVAHQVEQPALVVAVLGSRGFENLFDAWAAAGVDEPCRDLGHQTAHVQLHRRLPITQT